jgi:L-threonylcarbamoyladenylate synthase
MRCWQERVAARRLRNGGLIAHATEGVFGLGCHAFDEDACARVALLKGRSSKKPFIVVVAEFAQIAAVADQTRVDFRAISASWPGPETWIFPATTAAPRWLISDQRTIAVRVTAHGQFNRLCMAVGPIVSTSANLPGRRPALNVLQARRYFGHTVDFYLPGMLTSPGRPSRIRDARSGSALRS